MRRVKTGNTSHPLVVSYSRGDLSSRCSTLNRLKTCYYIKRTVVYRGEMMTFPPSRRLFNTDGRRPQVQCFVINAFWHSKVFPVLHSVSTRQVACINTDTSNIRLRILWIIPFNENPPCFARFLIDRLQILPYTYKQICDANLHRNEGVQEISVCVWVCGMGWCHYGRILIVHSALFVNSLLKLEITAWQGDGGFFRCTWQF